MNTKKWEYDKMLNLYKDNENQEFDNSLKFINPVYYRIDPDTGEKFFKYNEPPQYNIELHGFNWLVVGWYKHIFQNKGWCFKC